MGKIIAFAGSNSKESINQKLILATASLASKYQIEVINLRDYPAPIFGVDLEEEQGYPETMKSLKQKFLQADGFIVSTPEHNGSMPAVLKNTLDWISRMGGKIFNNKPTVFLSTSTGARGAKSALGHLLDIMPYRGAMIVGHYSLGSFNEHYQNGSLSNEKVLEIAEVIEKLEDAVDQATEERVQ